ncbi:unnamed protein product [Rhizoctonia solani]|uniref:Major facilitator superfamily (MFS) profile domain-containing protein n=1 Tax=Rhizoctonia solani TaxID=456999 RepID=A0A8H3BWX2_9AGAM|nr:unnamed protein product [Rhizoctonia solani]
MISTNLPRLDEDGDSRGRCASIDGADNRCPQEIVAQQQTPLPVKQVFVLCLMRFAEPISLTVISPFVNQMIEELGVTSDPKELGFYSGFVDGVVALAQFCTICFWGSLSDRIGRRPVLILGLCGIVGSTIMFGLSKSFTMMLISRALGGALNGNVAVIKSVSGEITDETNRGIAFAYLSLCWSMGSLLAPALGGFLSHPAERYPFVFGYGLFRQYPYLLPCLVGSGFSTIGLIAAIFFLEESLPKDETPTSHHAERQPLLNSNPRNLIRSCSTSTTEPISNTRPPSPNAYKLTLDGVEKHAPSIKELMQIRIIRQVLVSYGFIAFVTVSINAVLVLWLYTPVSAGGIGFSAINSRDLFLLELTHALSGLFGTSMAVIVFPPLERRVGTVFLYRSGMIMQVLNVLTFPLGHALALAGGKQGAYLGAATVLVVRCIAGMVFICNMLLVTRSAPCRRSLGAVNGLAQMVANASRAVGPVLATSLFAFSVKSDILGGNLIWLLLSLVALLGVAATCQIPTDRPLDSESSRQN